MGRLTVEQWGIPSGAYRTMRIGGFSDGELNELKSMNHHEAEETLLDMLDDRNQGQGTCWYRGYGIGSVWFDNEYAYLNVGKSCD